MNRAEKRRRLKLDKKAAKNEAHGKSGGSRPERPQQTIQQAMDLAVQNHTAGRLPVAETMYREILKSDPNQPIALHLLGVISHQMGNPGVAVDLITKAIAINPDDADAYYNRGLALQDLGRMDEAVASYRDAIAIKPDYVEAHGNLGNVLQDLGKLNDAVASYHMALSLKPDYAEAHYNLGNALKDLGMQDDAAASFQKAIDFNSEFAEAHFNLGNALKELGKLNEAEASYHMALNLSPDFAEANNAIGNVLQDLGRLDDAAECYHKALKKKPDFAEANRNLANVKVFSKYDNDINAMEDAYAAPGLGDEQRMHLAFGLGKAFEDLREYEKAFGFFLTGNFIKRGTLDYSNEGVEKSFGNLMNLFSNGLLAERQRTGSSDEPPIFILGMPRSGTTLVEQILASHPDVLGGGELDYLTRTVVTNFSKINDAKFNDSVNQAGAGRFSNAGTEYMELTRKRFPEARFITDKLPYNFQLIGMIRLILPNAKIIHCCRDKRDTCLSIFKNYFTKDSHYYAYDLCELGQFYNLYSNLMNHWHSVLPGFIYDIHYEDLVSDQERNSRALIEYCGLEWDD